MSDPMCSTSRTCSERSHAHARASSTAASNYDESCPLKKHRVTQQSFSARVVLAVTLELLEDHGGNLDLPFSDDGQEQKCRMRSCEKTFSSPWALIQHLTSCPDVTRGEVECRSSGCKTCKCQDLKRWPTTPVTLRSPTNCLRTTIGKRKRSQYSGSEPSASGKGSPVDSGEGEDESGECSQHQQETPDSEAAPSKDMSDKHEMDASSFWSELPGSGEFDPVEYAFQHPLRNQTVPPVPEPKRRCTPKSWQLTHYSISKSSTSPMEETTLITPQTTTTASSATWMTPIQPPWTATSSDTTLLGESPHEKFPTLASPGLTSPQPPSGNFHDAHSLSHGQTKDPGAPMLTLETCMLSNNAMMIQHVHDAQSAETGQATIPDFGFEVDYSISTASGVYAAQQGDPGQANVVPPMPTYPFGHEETAPLLSGLQITPLSQADTVANAFGGGQSVSHAQFDSNSQVAAVAEAAMHMRNIATPESQQWALVDRMLAVALNRNIKECPWPGCKHKPKGPNTKNWRSHLRRHLRTHLPSQKIPCPVKDCAATFSARRQDNLRAHLARVHKGEKSAVSETPEHDIIKLEEFYPESWTGSESVTTCLGLWSTDEDLQNCVPEFNVGQDTMFTDGRGDDQGTSLLQSAFGSMEVGVDYLETPIERPSDLRLGEWNI